MPLGLSVNFRSIERAATGLMDRDLISTQVLIRAGASIIVKYMKEEAPHRTNALRNSIQAKTAAARSEIWGLFYGRYHIEGTGIYGPKKRPIVPVRAKVLRFVIGDRVIFAKSVRGIKPNRFDQRAVERAKPALRVLMLENGRRLGRVISGAA